MSTPNSEELKALQAEAQAYVNENLTDLCKELVEYTETGILCNGKIRVLWRMVTYSGPSAQSLAIGMIKHAALRKVAG
jgi:hypothetical protein